MEGTVKTMLGRGALVVASSVVALVVAAVPAPSAHVPNAGAAEVEPAEREAHAALERLGLVDRAAQLVVTAVPGTALAPADARRIRALRPGGVIVFGGNYRSRQQLVRLLRAVRVAAQAGDPTRPAVLASIDQEGGVVKRIADAPPTLSHPQLGRLDRAATTRRQALATATALRATGIRMDLAPVADLDIGPRHVMRERSFGARPALVSRHVAAFTDGLAAGGVASSVKHFPGFGGASVNSDDALAPIARTAAQLRREDLEPFRAAVAHGAGSVMVSHGVYRALDRRRPASTSPAAYRLLRSSIGYDGVAITDSLHARGFLQGIHASVAEGCVRAVAAGADMVLLTGSLQDAARCRAALLAAVRSGRVPRARLDEAALRVLRLKARLGLAGVSRPSPAG
jgi:beta-N-acetylhexosaminidase